jgi:hypothetical protein
MQSERKIRNPIDSFLPVLPRYLFHHGKSKLAHVKDKVGAKVRQALLEPLRLDLGRVEHTERVQEHFVKLAHDVLQLSDSDSLLRGGRMMRRARDGILAEKGHAQAVQRSETVEQECQVGLQFRAVAAGARL